MEVALKRVTEVAQQEWRAFTCIGGPVDLEEKYYAGAQAPTRENEVPLEVP